MSRYAHQFSAAALAYDNASPDETEFDSESGVLAVAEQLVRDDEVSEVVQELFDAGDAILAALGAQQQATGRAPSYEVVRVMQRIRSILKIVESHA